MSNQKAFDIAVEGLLKQGKKSENSCGSCLYRGPDGQKCAVGFLIPDELYDPKFEGEEADSDELKEIITKLGYSTKFLLKLQTIHDYAEPISWKEKFKALADEFGLKWKFDNL